MNPDSRSDAIEASDTVMVKADALIHRHHARTSMVADSDLPLLDDILGEDLPLLDDIAERAPEPIPEPAFESANRPSAAEVDQLVAEHQQQLAALEAAHEAEQAAVKARLTELEVALEAARNQSMTTGMHVAEHLIELDAYIAQTIEAWVSNELPQIVASELDGLVERLRVQTLAHMRATLIPELSEKLSETLDASVNSSKTPAS